MTPDKATLINALEHCTTSVKDVNGTRVTEIGNCSACPLRDERIGVCTDFEYEHACVPVSLIQQAVSLLKDDTRYYDGLRDMLNAIRTAFMMNDNQRRMYFDIDRRDKFPFEAIIKATGIDAIMNGANAYRRDEDEAEHKRRVENLTKLADEIGIHALYAMVKEMRGEGGDAK